PLARHVEDRAADQIGRVDLAVLELGQIFAERLDRLSAQRLGGVAVGDPAQLDQRIAALGQRAHDRELAPADPHALHVEQRLRADSAHQALYPVGPTHRSDYPPAHERDYSTISSA